MITRSGSTETPRASTYLDRLCRHFSKKIPVEHDETAGHARFPFGECRLEADETTLRFHCRADDEASLAKIMDVIERHVWMFTKRDPLEVEWGDPERH